MKNTIKVVFQGTGIGFSGYVVGCGSGGPCANAAVFGVGSAMQQAVTASGYSTYQASITASGSVNPITRTTMFTGTVTITFGPLVTANEG